MSDTPLTAESVPKLKDFVKFRYNEVRRQWVILGPERLLQPDDTAVEILKKVDGKRSIKQIVQELINAYNAPQETITADVLTLLTQLAQKGFLADERDAKGQEAEGQGAKEQEAKEQETKGQEEKATDGKATEGKEN